jgi:hypothetical protein
MEKSILPPGWNVPEVFRNRLGAKVGRQRPMAADDHLLLMLHAPPKPEENERVGRFFWRAPDGLWSSNGLGSGPAALNQHLDEYYSIIQHLDEQEEKAASADEYFEIIEAVAPICRATRNLHQVLQETRALCPDIREIIDLRDRAYELERTAELLYNGTKDGLEFAIAKRAEEQAKSSEHMALSAHRLNSLVAFFFPIATLTAVFGVNLPHGYEDSKPPYAFLIVIAVGLTLGAMLSAFVSRSQDD